MAQDTQDATTDHPVAYDTQGRPLYARPQPSQPAQNSDAPQVVYMARPHDPVQPVISPRVMEKHQASLRTFPFLNLSDGEYVVSAIRRHPIGILTIWGGIGIVLGALFLALGVLITDTDAAATIGAFGDVTSLNLVLLSLAVLFFIIGIIATVIYNGNRFFLTNESVIQHIQTSLFSKKVQSISLANIEDASYRQHGIIQHLLGYGSLRLSTEGDETTYRFSFVSNPHHQVNLLNDAVEAFKNGRPLGDDD